MDLEEQLAVINDAYFNLEEDDAEGKDQILAELKRLHLQLLKDPANLSDFIFDAARAAGGIYIPYLFWMELVKFMDGKAQEDVMLDLIKEFAVSDFEEDERKKMKPLLAIYFAQQREFEVDRIKLAMSEKSHHDVRDFFNALFRFKEVNAKSVEAYTHKFKLLKNYYPNFEMFNLPVSRLEEELA